MRKITIFIAIFISLSANSQELKCNVNISNTQIANTNVKMFEQLKKSIGEIMNNTHWTNLTFSPNERIDCSLGVVIKSYENNIITCEFQVQARRPVWGSNYFTPIFNFRDVAVKFAYNETDQLVINQTYDNNLVALLAYYAYIIIGFDMDSFQKFGGNQYFSKAENIVNLSQSRPDPESEGWKVFDKKGKRYELVSSLLDDRLKSFREYFYDYHRLGLDAMTSNAANARAKIASGLSVLIDINRIQPQTQLMITFIDTKKDELINIFAKHGTEKENEKVYDILTTLNPSSTDIYSKLKEK